MNTSSALTVLIHGGHAASWVWEPLQSQLVTQSIAVDLPAHGACSGQLRGLRIADCTESIVANLPEDQPIILVGHSLGAAIALAASESIGTRLAHLVLVAGPVPQSGQSVVSAFPFVMRLASRLVLFCNPHEFSQAAKVAKATLLNGLPAVLADNTAARFTNESTSLVLDPFEWALPLTTSVTYVQCLKDRGPLTPTHQVSMAERLGTRAKLVSIDACHYVMLEKPDELAAVINNLTTNS